MQFLFHGLYFDVINFPDKMSKIKMVTVFGAGCLSSYIATSDIISRVKDRNKPKVTILNLRGTISSGKAPGRLNFEQLKKPIDKAFAKKDTKEVCLVINSPGGSPQQSELIADRIKFLSEKNSIPVTSFVEDAAASGGYWLACAGSNIYTTQSSIVGSIGVISMRLGFHELIQKWGIENRTRTIGKNKAFWDPFSPETPEGKAITDKIMKRLYDNFTDFVKKCRGDRLKGGDDVLFTGEAWVGEDGLDLGLIDGFDSVHHYLEIKYGDDVNIVEVNPSKQGLGAFLSRTFADIVRLELEDIVWQSKF